MRKELIVHKDPKSPISETFRTLRTNIQFMNTSRKLKVLQVTSAFPGEGKSWIASNIAVTFAQAGKKVVLIDADMRKGRQYVIFGVAPKPGLSNYLSGVNELESENEDLSNYIQATEVPNLYLIPAGNVPPNPSELLVSSQMINLIERLKELCDIVIVDGTPCELVADSIILSRIVDTSVIVTAYKTTKKDALETAVKNIKNVGGNIAGVVINKIPSGGKKMEEKYYYYGESSSGRNGKKKSSSKLSFSFSSSKSDKKPSKPKEQTERSAATPLPIEEKVKVHTVEQNSNQENKNDGPSLEKTNDILKQINEYLEQEKSKLK